MVNPLISFEKDDGSPPPDEGEVGFVIQVGPRFYGMFDTDDDAFAAATRRFKDFNVRPVLPL